MTIETAGARLFLPNRRWPYTFHSKNRHISDIAYPPVGSSSRSASLSHLFLCRAIDACESPILTNHIWSLCLSHHTGCSREALTTLLKSNPAVADRLHVTLKPPLQSQQRIH